MRCVVVNSASCLKALVVRESVINIRRHCKFLGLIRMNNFMARSTVIQRCV